MSIDVGVGGGGQLKTSGGPTRLNYLATGTGGAQPFSIAQWVRHDAIAAEQTYMNKYQAEGPLMRTIPAAPKARIFCVDGGGSGQEAIGSTTLAVNTWYHIGGAWDGSSVLKVVLNGVANGTATMTARDTVNATAAEWCFGLRSSAGSNAFDGLVEHIAIWDAFVADAEFMALYSGVSPLFIRSSNLKGYWPCYQGAASVKTSEISGGGAACDLIANANVAQGTRGSPCGPLVCG